MGENRLEFESSLKEAIGGEGSEPLADFCAILIGRRAD